MIPVRISSNYKFNENSVYLRLKSIHISLIFIYIFCFIVLIITITKKDESFEKDSINKKKIILV